MQKLIRSLLCSCILKILIWRMYLCFEIREKRILLNDDGTLKSTKDTPSCGSDTLIDLIGYSYRQIQCHFVDGCRTHYEEFLSPAAEFRLHTMCSWKEECVNMSFPLRSKEQTALTKAVNLKYTCQDRRNFINMCMNKVTEFSDTVYITTDDTATLFKECYRFVSKGNFALNISDVRLTNKNGLGCSSTVLLINNYEYICDEASGSFGSVFHRNIIRSSVNAFISVALNSPTVTPDSIVITLIPEESAKLSCYTKNPLSTSAPGADSRHSKTQSVWFSTTVSPEFTTHNELDKTNFLSEREAYFVATIVMLCLALGVCTAVNLNLSKRLTDKQSMWHCLRPRPKPKCYFGSTPDASHNPDSSKLEIGVGNKRATGALPEEHELLKEEDQGVNSDGQSQMNMKTFNAVGKNTTLMKHNDFIDLEMTNQKETLLPQPELPAKIFYRHSEM